MSLSISSRGFPASMEAKLAAAGDQLSFFGYGAGTTFTNVDATHWEVNYAGGAAQSSSRS